MLIIPKIDNREKKCRGTPAPPLRVDCLVLRFASFAHRLLDLILRLLLLLLLRDGLVLGGAGCVLLDATLIGWCAFALMIGHLESPSVNVWIDFVSQQCIP
jgi:hypothetical protein